MSRGRGLHFEVRRNSQAFRRAPLPAALLAVVLLSASAWTQNSRQAGPASLAPPKAPPATRTDPVSEVLHGTTVVDPYRWLEDQNSPETRAWIDAQNAYTQSALGARPEREQLKQRVAALLKTEQYSVPLVRNGRYFFSKRLPDQDQPVLYLRKGLKGADEALIDPARLSPDHSTTANFLSIAQDATLLVYGVRQGGADEVTPRVFDVDARKDLPDSFPKGRYSGVAVKPDKSGFYYTRMTPAGPRVFWHKLGTDAAGDREVFGAGYGPEKIIASALAEDGHYLLIHVLHGSAGDRSEVYVQDLARGGPLVSIVNDIPARFFGTIGGEQLFLHTNWKAPKGHVLAVDLNHPGREGWREVIPESSAIIEAVGLVGGRLAVLVTENVAPRVKLYAPEGKLEREIALPALGTASDLSGRWSSSEAFYSFSSLHIPPTIYHYDVATGAQEVWARPNVPLESSQYEIHQVWYASKDGTRVPMFVVHRKGLALDGSNPTLLTGYGGFNVTETPSYNARAAAWISGGGVYALANLRGGSEFGEEWHYAGMREKKQNVFDDFIAAAEWLIRNGYTRPSRLAIAGNSNGGLLVGAALTQRPELFAAVVCGFPLLDMLRYHKFLVARFWLPEYGSAENREQFKYIYAYSPYQHVQPGTKYPAVLLISGDSDTRVDPLHARKMTARLQAATVSGRPVLLHYDTWAGHSGGVPVSKQIDDLSEQLNFLFWQLGLSSDPSGN